MRRNSQESDLKISQGGVVGALDPKAIENDGYS